MVAYSSVSHLGFCMAGIFALTFAGVKGGILQMLNHGISTGGLFLLVGIMYERTHTRLIKDYGGLAKIMPVFAVFFMIITLSSIGLPGLNGFVGEIVILMGAYHMSPDLAFSKSILFILVSGMLLGAAYMLWLYQRIFFGEVTNKKMEEQCTGKDMTGREWGYMIPLVIVALWIGLYPAPVMNKMDRSVDFIMSKVEPALERAGVQPKFPPEKVEDEHAEATPHGADLETEAVHEEGWTPEQPEGAAEGEPAAGEETTPETPGH